MSREPFTNSPLLEQIASQNFGNCSGGTVRSASRIINTSPRAASKPANTASPLPVTRLPRFAPSLEIIFVEGHPRGGTWEEIERVVAGMAFDEDDLERRGEAGKARDRGFDV